MFGKKKGSDSSSKAVKPEEEDLSLNHGHKITWLTKIGYGAGGMVNNGGLSFASSYLMIFCTTQAGMPVAEATIITSLSLVVDAIISPLIGFISDGFYSTKIGRKFGRRRFWLLIGVPLMCLQPLFFLVTPFGFWYYFIMYLLYNIAWTVSSLPLNCLPQEMTKDFRARGTLTGSFTIFGKVYAFILGMLTAVGFAYFGEDNSFSYFIIAAVDSVVIVISLLAAYFNSWETPIEEVATEHIEGVKESVKKLVIDIVSCFRVRSYRMATALNIFSHCATWLNSTALVYYTVYACGLTKAYSSAVGTPAKVMMIFVTGMFVAWTNKKGFKKPWLFVEGGIIIAFIGWFVTGALHDVMGTTVTMIVYAVVFWYWDFMTAGMYVIPNLINNFLPDVDELVTNRRREGEYAAVTRMISQFAKSIITAGFGVILAASGFISSKGNDVVQPDSVMWTILFTLLIGGIGFTVLGMISAHWLKINKENSDTLNAEIKRVHEGGSMADVDPKVKSICESLTGVRYEICFGHNGVGYKTPEDKAELEAWRAAHPELDGPISPERYAKQKGTQAA